MFERCFDVGTSLARRQKFIEVLEKFKEIFKSRAVVAVSHKCLATSHKPVLSFDDPNVKQKNRI